MVITCWGTRGSVATGGTEFAHYGGDTISVEIRSQNGRLVIIDAGTGIRKLGKTISPEERKENIISLFFTHYHLDHIIGAPFFTPMFDPNSRIDVYGPKLEGVTGVRDVFDVIMASPYSPLSLDNDTVKAKLSFKTISEIELQVDTLLIRTIKINHPNLGGLGYSIEEKGKKFVMLTDNELGYSHKNGSSYQQFVAFCQDADLLFHDAQYTTAEYKEHVGWGHSTIDEAVQLAKDANVKETKLFHYSPDRTDAAVNQLYEVSDRSCQPLIQGTQFRL